jgi:hypothetical protein
MLEAQAALKGSAVEFFYSDKGDLQRREIACCVWTPTCTSTTSSTTSSSSSSSSSHLLESWFSSGGYTKSPRSIQACLNAEDPVVIEAGAVFMQR